MSLCAIASHGQQDRPWLPGPAKPDLAPGELHLWLAHLDLLNHVVTAFHQTLSPDEQARAGRYHFERDRRRFVVARGVLRAILARYVELRPNELRFDYSSHGKPSLASASGRPLSTISFNLSHSGDLALYAIILGRQVGADIEQFRPEMAEEHIAERFFSAYEVAALRRLPSYERAPAFFRCWTRKEAFVKARGEGLSLPLNRFDVTVRADEPAALLRMSGESNEVARWSLHAIEVAPGYEASVAVEGTPSTIQQWNYTCIH